MAKEGSAGAGEKDKNLICVQILHLHGRCGGDGEQQPRQCAGTSFISAHLVCSHSSLTPLTDELQRLAELPADSAPAHAPSASSSLPLCRYLAPTLFPPPRIQGAVRLPSLKSHGEAECTDRKSWNDKARKTKRVLNPRHSKLNTSVYEEGRRATLSLPAVLLYLTIRFYCLVPAKSSASPSSHARGQSVCHAPCH